MRTQKTTLTRHNLMLDEQTLAALDWLQAGSKSDGGQGLSRSEAARAVIGAFHKACTTLGMQLPGCDSAEELQEAIVHWLVSAESAHRQNSHYTSTPEAGDKA